MRLSRYLQSFTTRSTGLARAISNRGGRLLSRKGALTAGAGTLIASFVVSRNNSAEYSEELFEKEIGASADFPEGQLRQVQVGPDKDNDFILVVRVQGKLYALGGKCSHFGAPLATGMLFDDLVVCPWHLAAFDIKTGYTENGPMIDGIPTYAITETDGKVVVKIPKDVKNSRKSIQTVKRDPANTQRFVIVGGGVAGASAAETLRQSGFTGEIIILSAEDHTPYDRSALTKAMLTIEPGMIAVRSKQYYEEIGVEIKTGTTVVGVETATKTVQTKNGEKIHYDKLLLATGAGASPLNVPGNKLGNIHSVRDFSDVYKIRESVKTAKNVVIVGGGLIGTETASNLKLDLKDKVNITLVTRGAPLQAHFGPEVGKVLESLATQNGVKVVHGSVQSFEGSRLLREAKERSTRSSWRTALCSTQTWSSLPWAESRTPGSSKT